ncbi:MAG: hypothetical protein U9O65_03960 [Thermotogota bacterium]|nr:hypothetical protein [Thermotogota bacterium]
MTKFRNVDDVVEDATICITIGDFDKPIDWSGIPEISDQVSLDTDEGYSMMVEVTGMSNDKALFKGKVINGYYPSEKSKQINEDEMVEFSRKKIAGIHKN